MKNVSILASHNGTGLDTLYKAYTDNLLDIHINLVISNNTHSPALLKAKNYNIQAELVNAKTHNNPDERIFELLQEHKAELVVLVGYMKKLSAKITENFTVINSHPALLPKHGGKGMYGRFVHEAVFAAKESKTGVTIHEVNEHYDEGAIVLQKEVAVETTDTPESIETKVKTLEKIAIVEAVQKCLK